MGAQAPTSTQPPSDWWLDPWYWMYFGESGGGGGGIPAPPPLPGSADLPGMPAPPTAPLPGPPDAPWPGGAPSDDWGPWGAPPPLPSGIDPSGMPAPPTGGLPPYVPQQYPYYPEPEEYYEPQGGGPSVPEQPSKPLGKREPGAPPTGPENEPPSQGGGGPSLGDWIKIGVGAGGIAILQNVATGEVKYETEHAEPAGPKPVEPPMPEPTVPTTPTAKPHTGFKLPVPGSPKPIPEPPPLPPAPTIPEGPAPPTEPLPPEPKPGFNPWDALSALGSLAGALGGKGGLGGGMPNFMGPAPIVGTNQPFTSLFGLPQVPQVQIPNLAQALRGGF